MTGSRRRFLAATVGATGLGLAGCLASDGDGPYGGYLSNANGFDGVVDRTDTDEVTVEVGVGDRGLAFGPAAVQIAPDTTVVWDWTGRGGSHNVVAEDGPFESEYHNTEDGSYTYTFETADVFEYYCSPHKASGMVGVIDVIE